MTKPKEDPQPYRFEEGNEAAAKPEGTHHVHRTVTIPPEIDAMIARWMKKWDRNRSQAMAELIAKALATKENESCNLTRQNQDT